MNIEMLRHFFAWCTVINFALLLLWFLLYMAAGSLMKDVSRRLFHISDEKFDSVNYSGILFYKVGIFLFNLAPYLALRIMAV